MKFIVATTLVIFVGAILVLYFKRRTHTKERFAFFALASVIAFASATVFPVLAGDSVFSLVESMVREAFGMSAGVGSGLYDKILSVIVFISIVWAATKFHANWEGPVTERQADLVQRFHEATPMPQFRFTVCRSRCGRRDQYWDRRCKS